jgi:2-keto-3-deoxy-L-rhamnonate aldolase RhmA
MSLERHLFMKNLKDRVRKGDTVFGCFLGLGSPLTAEIMGMAGYDWCQQSSENVVF